MNAAGNAGGAANAYDVDTLFRSARSGDGVPAANAAKIEATALSMLIGAFIASVAGALGGRLRDEHI